VKTIFSTLSDPPLRVTKLILNLLNAKVTDSSIESDLFYHPNYPSLLSLTDVISNYGIESVSFECEQSRFFELPTPLIVRLKSPINGESNFTVVKSITAENITYFEFGKSKWVTILSEIFLENKNSNIVTIFENKFNIEENSYSQKRSAELKQISIKYLVYFAIPLFATISIFSVILGRNPMSKYIVSITILSLLGSIVSSLLIWHDIDEYNPFLKQLCNYGKRIKCSAILNSKGSKILGISWSVIGFTFFTGILFYLLFTNPIESRDISLISSIIILSIFYIPFSIFYQWKIAKQWCLLCLLIQAIIFLQFLSYIFFSPAIIISELHILPFIFSFLIPMIVLFQFLPSVTSAKENKLNKAELQRLKHDPDIFYSILQKQEFISPPDRIGIYLGNSNSKNKIIKVCNPLCSPCSTTYIPMMKLLESKYDLQIQIIFNCYDSVYDKSSIPAKHLLSIYKSGNQQLINKALDEWYLSKKKDYLNFAKMFPICENIDQQNTEIQAMRSWCTLMEIKYTPTFYFNGYKLPDMYNLKDLKYFLSMEN